MPDDGSSTKRAAIVEPTSRHRVIARRLVEGGSLLALPPVLFLILRVRPMAPLDMIDPSLYTAFATHPQDLMWRYGPSNYFWVRLSTVIPEHLAMSLAGPVAGFFLLRYLLALLATIPAYLLFKRLGGVGAGTIAALIVFTSPVMLSAWGTDYPDAVAVSLLLAGAVFIALSAGTTLTAKPTRSTTWLVAGGLLLGLAIHCQASAIPFCACIVGSRLVVGRREGLRSLARMTLLIVLSVLVVTLVMVAVGYFWLAHANIFSPTWNQAHFLSRNSANWHTGGVGWMTKVPYLLVPPAVIAVWAGAMLGRGRRLAPAERIIAWTALSQAVVAFVLQVFFSAPILEFHLYSSMLWPSVLLLLASSVTMGVRDLPAGRTRNVALAVLGAMVVIVPLAGSHIFRPTTLSWIPLGVALILAATVAAWLSTHPITPQLVRPGAATAVIMILFVFGVAPTVPGGNAPSGLPFGKYGQVFDTPAGNQIDVYRASTELPSLVGNVRRPNAPLLLTWSHVTPANRRLMKKLSAQYLWHLNSLSDDMPNLSPGDVSVLRARRPGQLLLLSQTPSDFAKVVQALSANGYAPHVHSSGSVGSGDVLVFATVVDLRPPKAP